MRCGRGSVSYTHLVGLAEQLAPYGITVNAIAPGKTFTSMMVVENETNMNCESQPLSLIHILKLARKWSNFRIQKYAHQHTNGDFSCSKIKRRLLKLYRLQYKVCLLYTSSDSWRRCLSVRSC